MTQTATNINIASSNNSEHHLLNAVLKLSLEPLALIPKIEKILSFLCSCKELELENKIAVLFKKPGEETLQLKVALGISKKNITCQELQRGECHCGKIALTGRSVFIPIAPPFHTHIEKDKAPHYCIPISHEGSTIGIMVLYTTASHKKSPQLINFFESIGAIIASISEMQRMDEQLINVMDDLRLSIADLKEERKFSESIIQGLNHGILVVDTHGRIQKCNTAARAILRPFSVVLENRFLHEVFDKDTTATLLESGCDLGQQQERMLCVTPKNGVEIQLTFSSVIHEDTKGNNIGRIISISDISELFSIRKEMEKMNRLSTVAEIASAVAHEVRNPLAGIKIMAQSIEEEVPEGSEQHECSQRIIRQVDRLNELLSEFFSYARPGKPNKKPIGLINIIEETKHLIHSKLQKNNIDLILDLAPNLPHILADQNQMQQVFLNLFLNSIDAIKQGGEIRISAKIMTPILLKGYSNLIPLHQIKKSDVVVSFRDNGAGMNANSVEKAFEPFYTTKSSGTGLGLSIVYRTLKENDASIFLASQEGQGTTFTLFFKKGTL